MPVWRTKFCAVLFGRGVLYTSSVQEGYNCVQFIILARVQTRLHPYALTINPASEIKQNISVTHVIICIVHIVLCAALRSVPNMYLGSGLNAALCWKQMLPLILSMACVVSNIETGEHILYRDAERTDEESSSRIKMELVGYRNMVGKNALAQVHVFV